MVERDIKSLLNQYTPPNPGKLESWEPPMGEYAFDEPSEDDPAAEKQGGATIAQQPTRQAIARAVDLYDPAFMAEGGSGETATGSSGAPEEAAGEQWPTEPSDPEEVETLDIRRPHLVRLLLAEEELQERITIRSADRQIEVVADVGGRLHALTISQAASRTVHPRRLADQVLKTVNAARDQAAQAALAAAIRQGLVRE